MTLYDDSAADRRAALESHVLEWPDVVPRVTFGCPTYRVDETPFALVTTEGVVVTRLPPERRADLEARFDVGPFEAYGKTVESWLVVRVDADDVPDVVPFVRESYDAVRAA